MKLLVRYISSYTGDNLHLGIFSTKKTAEKARKEYIAIARKKDEWKDQAYHEVDLEKDVFIRDLKLDDKYNKKSSEAYLICRHTSGPGHSIIIPELLCSSKERSSKQIKALRKNKAGSDCFIDEYFLVDELEL